MKNLPVKKNAVQKQIDFVVDELVSRARHWHTAERGSAWKENVTTPLLSSLASANLPSR